jgi:hypothetical protein
MAKLSVKGDYVNLDASRVLAFASRLRFTPRRALGRTVPRDKRAIRYNLQESDPAIRPFPQDDPRVIRDDCVLVGVGADQAEHDRAHERRVIEAVAAAEEDLRLWREDVAQLEPEAEAALAAFRAAEDRAREAAEDARQDRVAHENAKGKVSPKEERDLLIRADTADSVAADAAEVMAARQAELTGADAELAASREGLADAEPRLERVRKAAERPAGAAPLTDVTIRANASYLQTDEAWATLDRDVRFRLHYLAEPRGVMSDQEFRAQMHEVLAMARGGA